MKDPSFITVGKIVGTFGLKGFLKVQVLTDFPERLETGRSIDIGDSSYKILDNFWHKFQVRILLEGIDTIEAAETLIGLMITVSELERPTLEKDEYYVQDLIGFKVFDQEGEELGRVEDICSNPAHALIQAGDHLIPAIKHFVKKIDLVKRIIRVRLIEGM